LAILNSSQNHRKIGLCGQNNLGSISLDWRIQVPSTSK
jgi:hypothetical protein